MGVFKEEASTFELIEKNQVRIYNDAADIGVAYQSTNRLPIQISEVIDTVKSLQALDKEFPNETGLIRSRETWDGGVTVIIRIAWEKDGSNYNGTEYNISFNKINPNHPSLLQKGKDAFITVHSKRYTEKA